jgi:hypothetical protein
MNSQKNVINGGFPPIKYCAKYEKNKNLKKERLFAPTININKLLKNSNSNKPIIDLENKKKEDLDIVDSI